MMDLRWIISKVQEEGCAFETAVLLEITSEKAGSFQVDTHGCKHNVEVLLMAIVNALVRNTLLVDQAGLPTNLGSNLVVW